MQLANIFVVYEPEITINFDCMAAKIIYLACNFFQLYSRMGDLLWITS